MNLALIPLLYVVRVLRTILLGQFRYTFRIGSLFRYKIIIIIILVVINLLQAL